MQPVIDLYLIEGTYIGNQLQKIDGAMDAALEEIARAPASCISRSQISQSPESYANSLIISIIIYICISPHFPSDVECRSSVAS